MPRTLEDLFVHKLQQIRSIDINITNDIKQFIQDRYNADEENTNPINFIIIRDRFHKHELDKQVRFDQIVTLYPHLAKDYLIVGSNKTFADYINEKDIIDIINQRLKALGMVCSPIDHLTFKLTDEEHKLLEIEHGNYGPIRNWNYQADIVIRDFASHIIKMVHLI